MKVFAFQKLEIWKRSIELAVEIHKNFSPTLDLTFSNQIRRAALSISNNIAEGYDRGSSREFIRFLFIAKGSLAEVRSMIYLAHKLSYLSEEDLSRYLDITLQLNKMLWGLIRHLKDNPSKYG